jgi:acyl-CoA reductase-like NAD-dependent aldehyde dehydrogenase
MTKPQIKIVNVTTGEEVVRDATAEEIAQIELDAANAEARKQAEAQAAAQRQALLSRLGITEEEARILLGGN